MIGGDRVSNEGNAWLNMFILLTFNIFSCQYLAEIFYKREIIVEELDFFVAILIGLFVYFKSVYKNKFLSNILKFKLYTKTQNILGSGAVILYFVLSIILFFYLYDYHRAFINKS